MNIPFPPGPAAPRIDLLLCGLKDAAEALNTSLEAVKRQPVTAQARFGRNSRKQIVHTLMEQVEQRYGIAPSEQMQRKLVRIFTPMAVAELEHWANTLLAPGVPETEWLSLVECLTVHETYFDRDKEQLETLLSVILPGLIEQKLKAGDCSLRVWSAGCASGEETYNLAMLVLMALHESSLAFEYPDGSIFARPDWSISVLGSDVSSQMIRIAGSGTYTTGKMGAFRTMRPSLWRFFEEQVRGPEEAGSGRTFSVKSCIAEITRFRRHNILEPLPPPASFDLVLCRNLLIYFDKKKGAVQEQLYKYLAPGGSLLLGATDVLLQQTGLERLQHGGSVWYRKK